MVRAIGRSVVLLTVVVSVSAAACSRGPAASKVAALKQGDEYAARGEYAEAAIAYRVAVQLDQKLPEARLKLADAYVRLKESAKAFGEYRRAADLLPEDRDLQLKVGRLMLAAGQFEDAKGKAERLLAKRSTDVDAQLLHANALAGLKDLDSAIEEIETALHHEPYRAETFANLGAAHMARGHQHDAEVAFRRAVEVNPESVDAHLAFANFLDHENRRDEAAAEFKAAFALAPNRPATNRYLAIHAFAAGRPADAEPYLAALANGGDVNARFALAQVMIGTGRPDQGRKILVDLASNAPTYAAASVLLASLEYAEHSIAAGDRLVDEVLSREPRNVDALLLKARIRLDRKDVQSARECAEQAVSISADSPNAHFMLGAVQATRGNNAAARAAFLQALNLNPTMISAINALARLSLRTAAYIEARSYSEQALQLRPDDPDARLIHAQALVGIGQIADADREARALLNEFPQAPDLHVAMGAVRIAQKDHAGGVRLINRALEIDPDNLDALRLLVTLDLRAGNATAARSRVDARLVQDPASSSLLLLSATTYLSTGDAETAESRLKKAIEVDTANLRAYTMLGNLYVQQHRLDEARAEFERVLETDPRSIPLLTMTAILLDMKGDKDRAEAGYEKVLAVDSHAAIAANNLAWLLADSGRDLGRALTLAQTAKEKLADHPAVDDTLGWIYFKHQMLAPAIAALEASVQYLGNDAAVRYHLGLAYAQAGQHEKAKTQLKRGLELDPRAKLADEARKTLASLGA